MTSCRKNLKGHRLQKSFKRFRILVTAKLGFRNPGPKPRLEALKSMRLTVGPNNCATNLRKHLINLMFRANVARKVRAQKGVRISLRTEFVHKLWAKTGAHKLCYA